MRSLRRSACRLYPTHAQASELNARLDAACDLYNATLRDLHRAWAEREFPLADHPSTALVGPVSSRLDVDRACPPLTVGDDVVHRARQAFGAFALKRRRANAPGVPPFRARRYFVSLTFPDCSSGTRGGLDLPGVGSVAVNDVRLLPTHAVAVTVKHQGQIWQACY